MTRAFELSDMCDLCRDKDKIVVDVEELKTNDLLVLGNRDLTCISESGLYLYQDGELGLSKIFERRINIEDSWGVYPRRTRSR